MPPVDDCDFERYDARGGTEIAQELFDKGLIWAINHAVLHQHGYSLGVTTNETNPEIVTDIFIAKAPDEIVFSDDTGLHGYKKYLDSH